MKFDWRMVEESDEADPQPPNPQRRRGRVLLGFIMFCLLLGLIRLTWDWFLRRADSALIRQVEEQLAAEQMARQNQDVDLLWTLLDGDAAAFSHALPPSPALTLTHVELHEPELWVTAIWRDGAQTWQKRLFFQQDGEQLIHQLYSPRFWGEWQPPSPHPWGTLTLRSADALWQEAIAAFVSQWLAEQCDPCLTERLPFNLTIAPDWQLTAAANEVRLPSPYLVAFTAEGEPGEPFWALLTQHLSDYLTPATIRFAVPGMEPGVNWESSYRLVAEQFAQENPHIQVELVVVDRATPMSQWLPTVDGMALPVDAAALRAGLVQDLTNLAASDPTFAAGDFYEQTWQGALWQERLWFVPQSAHLRLVFYDRTYFAQAGLPPPSLTWTWDEWQTQMDSLRQWFPAEQLSWPYLDISRDTLLAYAYNWDNHCAEPHTIQCPLRLQTGQIAAALSWYTQIIPTLQPDLTAQTAEEQELVALNLVSLPREVAVWVSEPGRYELENSLQPVGVTVFPGTDTHPGMTPLWVQGGAMSAGTTRPRAVWAWLKFLSFQSLDRGRRAVPARYSVAQATNYWQTLIAPLRQPVLMAFTAGRPVLLAEQGVFGAAQVRAVVTGAMEPFAAASSTFTSP